MGIKNFTARRSTSVNQQQAVQVKDYMTRKLVTFSPDQGVSNVMDTLLKQRITL